MEMKPNKWSCMVTAFANAIDVPTSKVIDAIGHDGSLIIDENGVDPHRRRGFHYEELVLAGFKLNYAVMCVHRFVNLGNCSRGKITSVPLSFAKVVDSIIVPMVVIGTTAYGLRHAVTKINGKLIDPDNLNEVDPKHITPEMYLIPFWIGL